MSTGNRLREYALLMRLDRPIGTLLLLWPALWALWVAGSGAPSPQIAAVFVVGAFLMRSAGCVINDYADRGIDPHVRRTRNRPLAAKRVRPREALGLFAVLCLTAFALVLTLNALTIAMSFVGLLLATTYPFMKRYHHWPQVNLGAAFGWAVPMAFAAQTGSVPVEGWLLFAVAVIWAVAYDTLYAMVDREDDLRIGVRSTAILFGNLDRLAVAVAQVLVLAGLFLFGRSVGLGPAYWLGLIAAASLMAHQQYLAREREPAACFRAFLNNNWVGLAVFLGILGSYLWTPASTA
jgi:4-hydroxybenzoate polyprenyltransferase